MTRALEVLAPGLLTSIQDVRGRPHMARFGVSAAGALDPFAAARANALVDNPPGAALLEVTLVGPTLRFTDITVFALTGADLSAELDTRTLRPGWSYLARAGATLAFGERRGGARAYLGFGGGGLALPPVLGSRSTDIRAGFNGLAGRALRAGDRLPLKHTDRDPLTLAGRCLAVASESVNPDQVIRVVPGPHVHHFVPGELERFCSSAWQISDQADRMGYRLVGPAVRHAGSAGVASLGLPVGAVQVPGDGRPIVLLADHQPTGGYTVLACVIRADLDLLAQRGPGDQVHFALVTLEEAHAALQARPNELRVFDPDALTWAALRWAR